MGEDKYSTSDISESFIEQSEKELDEFFNLAESLFTEDELDLNQIAHDFWLTRNGHGAGFWDGDYVNGDAITKIVNDNFSENDHELNDSILIVA